MFLILFGMLAAFVYMVIHYVKGLVGSPREIYFMFFIKLTEYSAYGAASYTVVLYLVISVLAAKELRPMTPFSAW